MGNRSLYGFYHPEHMKYACAVTQTLSAEDIVTQAIRGIAASRAAVKQMASTTIHEIVTRQKRLMVNRSDRAFNGVGGSRLDSSSPVRLLFPNSPSPRSQQTLTSSNEAGVRRGGSLACRSPIEIEKRRASRNLRLVIGFSSTSHLADNHHRLASLIRGKGIPPAAPIRHISPVNDI